MCEDIPEAFGNSLLATGHHELEFIKKPIETDYLSSTLNKSIIAKKSLFSGFNNKLGN